MYGVRDLGNPWGVTQTLRDYGYK
jgi:uncharacterized beta-barrel protein YwiB (DUF1934 family)